MALASKSKNSEQAEDQQGGRDDFHQASSPTFEFDGVHELSGMNGV